METIILHPAYAGGSTDIATQAAGKWTDLCYEKERLGRKGWGGKPRGDKDAKKTRISTSYLMSYLSQRPQTHVAHMHEDPLRPVFLFFFQYPHTAWGMARGLVIPSVMTPSSGSSNSSSKDLPCPSLDVPAAATGTPEAQTRQERETFVSLTFALRKTDFRK